MPKPNPSPIKRTRRRFIRRLLGRTTLGFIIAILAALTAHAFSDIHSKDPTILVERQQHATRKHLMHAGHIRKAFGTSLVGINAVRQPLPEEKPIAPIWQPNLAEAIRVEDLPGWVRKDHLVPNGTVQLAHIETLSAGVPFRMLRYVTMVYEIPSNPPWLNSAKSERLAMWKCPFRKDLPSPAAVRPLATRWRVNYGPLRATVWGALDIHGPAHRFQQNHSIILPTQIPLTPIWPGLLANTAIYATLIWLILAALATLRRRIHRWRNPNAIPCKHCHYDLTNLTTNHCPECGRPIPSNIPPSPTQ